MVELEKATIDDAKQLWEMQISTFKDLLDRYQDFDTNPGNESLDKVIARLQHPFTYFYFIRFNGKRVGAIRVVDSKESDKRKRIAPIFVLPEFQNNGIAQNAIELAEEIHGNTFWQLDTILQETGNCHLYEKLGYQKTGETEEINDSMTLVYYIKD